ncbi:LysR family transcriptional regulator [Vibrio sp. TBV020]|uniref:LysR family transcriptional regulator n=1 Tax=Vibrio sp. TBV020 TaxID=3137398 RepID=UPI0038CD9CB2
MDLKLDLNLLSVLILLNKHRQLKPVAKALGKTESAVSKYLAKLRTQLDDPLFVRGPVEFEPTEYMSDLIPVFTSSLDAIQSAIVHGAFNPKEYEREIVVALPSVIQYWIGDKLMADLFTTFPKASISLISWDKYSKNDLIESRADIGIHYFNSELPKSIYQHDLGYFLPKVIVSESSGVNDVESALKLPFLMPPTKGESYYGAISRAILNKHDINIDVKGVIDNVTCLLNTIGTCGYATILHNFDMTIGGYKSFSLPREIEQHEFPKVVAIYRTINRGQPLQEILLEHIQRYVK